jgi:hypothetical protein
VRYVRRDDRRNAIGAETPDKGLREAQGKSFLVDLQSGLEILLLAEELAMTIH